ncbi:MAG: GreA/GreB family elongation factor [Anaerolineae bacterium]|nr:GreA/GreB family elongation factor [Anaerolineae bacterium]
MSKHPGSKRWTREEWEALLEEERRAEAARPPVVALGARVQVELVDELGGVEALDLALVPDADADLARGFLGQGTPLGRAIAGQRAGTTLPYKQGDMAEVRILSVVPDDVPDTGAAAKRQAVIQQAVERSEIQDIARLALTVDVKWGAYDPNGILPGDEEPSAPPKGVA